MTEATIPLVGSPDLRNENAYDFLSRGQRFINCVFDVVQNQLTGAGKVYVNKKNDLQGVDLNVSVGNNGVAVSDDNAIVVFDNSNGVVFHRDTSTTATNCGNVGSNVYRGITTAYIGGERVWLINTLSGGYFLAYGALSGGSTFTANRTSGSVTLAAVSSFTGLYVGQLLTGTGIASGARIASMNTGASTLDMTIAATSGAATSTTVTRERIAKIIDADFPSTLRGGMVEVDGYVFVGAQNTQRIYNSQQNSITSWAASDYLTLSAQSGVVIHCDKYKGRLVGFGASGIEFFYNAGNSSGSPFSRTGDASNVGTSQDKDGNPRKSVTRIDDETYFISQTQEIYAISGGTPQIVSVPSVVKVLQSGNTADSHLYSIFINGKKMLAVVDNGGNFFFTYDPSTKIWTEQTWGATYAFGGTEGTVNLSLDGAFTAAVATSVTTGHIFVLDGNSPAYQETLTIQTARIDFGSGNRTSIQMVELDSDIQASGTATLEISDDDAQTWTTIGTFDMTQDHPRIYRCGSYKGGINFRITHSANTAFRASTLRVVYSKGSI